MLSEGRGRGWTLRDVAVYAFAAGIAWLALLGAYVTVRAVVGWLT